MVKPDHCAARYLCNASGDQGQHNHKIIRGEVMREHMDPEQYGERQDLKIPGVLRNGFHVSKDPTGRPIVQHGSGPDPKLPWFWRDRNCHHPPRP